MIDHYFIFRFLAFRLFSATHAHVNITYVAFGLERCGNAVSLHSLVFLHTLLLRCVCFLCAAAIPSQCLNIVTFQAPTPFPPTMPHVLHFVFAGPSLCFLILDPSCKFQVGKQQIALLGWLLIDQDAKKSPCSDRSDFRRE